jgi:hypothetical protein
MTSQEFKNIVLHLNLILFFNLKQMKKLRFNYYKPYILFMLYFKYFLNFMYKKYLRRHHFLLLIEKSIKQNRVALPIRQTLGFLWLVKIIKILTLTSNFKLFVIIIMKTTLKV